MEEGFIVVNKGSEDNQIELSDLPPGFRFHPTDEEIITYYLIQKVVNGDFTASAIGEADLNKCEPWDLPKKAKMGEKEWYFFCQRDRKYPTGIRTNRATESGYWKATGKDREIHKGKGSSCLVGMKKTLVFYIGRAPKGEKTNWVMHEYRLEGKFSHYNLPKSAKDEWVVCRVFHKNTGNNNNNKKTIIPEIQGLLRVNSFGVDDILNCSNSLPPLTDDPPYDYNIYSNVDNKTPLTRSLNSTCPDQPNSKFYYSINVDPSNILHPYQHQINPHSYFPDNNHNNKALMGYYFPKGIILGNSGSVAFDDHHIKAEVSNQSACMISLSQDTTEISSVVSKEEIPSVSNDNNNKKPTISLYGRGFDFEGPSSSVRPNPISDLQGSVWDDL